MGGDQRPSTIAGVVLAPPTGGLSLGVTALGVLLWGVDIGVKASDHRAKREQLVDLHLDLEDVEDKIRATEEQENQKRLAELQAQLQIAQGTSSLSGAVQSVEAPEVQRLNIEL